MYTENQSALGTVTCLKRKTTTTTKCRNTPKGVSGVFVIFLLSGRRKGAMKTAIPKLKISNIGRID